MRSSLQIKLALTVSLAGIVYGQLEDVCFYTGEECATSIEIDITTTASPRECSQYCDSLTDDDDYCSFFVHNAESGECYTFFDCDMIVSGSCPNCVSGPRHCEEAKLCHMPGQEPLMIMSGIETPDDCLRFCQDLGQSNCDWYTHLQDDQECIIYQNCQEISSLECSDCVYGQQDCTPRDDTSDDQMYLMIVGGEEYRDDMAYSSFIYQLGGSNYDVCEVDMENYFGPPGDTVRGIQEHIVMLDGSGTPVVCGGLLGQGRENAVPAGDQCYVPVLNISNYDEWHSTPYTMIHDRIGAFVVQLDNGQYWILGGNENIAETELYIDGAFEFGPDMPAILDRTCAAKIGDDRVIIAGGFSFQNGASLDVLWMYDWSTNEWVTDLAPMTLARHGHCCGARVNSDGDMDFIVVGGVGADSSTEVYNIQDNTWTNGPQYPYEEFRYGSCIPYGDTFAVLGGRNVEGDEFYDDCYSLTKSNQWEGLIHEDYDRFSQAAVVYLSKEKVAEYGCTRLFE